MTNIPSAISAAMKMEGSYVASVVLTGLAVVFLALLLLIIVFKIFGVVFSRKPKAKTAKRQKAKNSTPVSAVSKATGESNTTAPATIQSSAPPAIEKGIDLEVIAVITAAIAAMSASSGKKMRLVSVKTSGASRRAWAQAGINDNTRPF